MTKFILRNPDGSIQFDHNDRIVKVIGLINLGNVNGSIDVGNDTDSSDIWYSVFLAPNQMMRIPPVITISGKNINWSFSEAGYPASGGNTGNPILLYGVY
ncbi:hypothetical protein BHG07_02950 [Brenneria salicis ATCC 15712 = DSM 30166]|nr:hypothetical protein BHG07_02950 [Brenneria salicis ATCC 15712 = DSM 30166]